MKNTLYIVIPAYNESANIEQLIKNWYPIVQKHDGEGKSRLLIVNDGSKDNTYELIQRAQESRPLLLGLAKPNGGHGSTVLFGYRYAIEHHADFIFQTDSDNQTNPTEFEGFWNLRYKYDAIIGNRATRQDGKQRVFVEKTLLTLLRLYYGVHIPDSNAPFRLMKASLVAKYINKLPQNFNLPNVMLTTYFAYFKENITFRKITFAPRQGGVNSINIPKIVKIGWHALGDFRMLKKHLND
jgi:glycosyltransferase involved in cell wall biosynthesis